MILPRDCKDLGNGFTYLVMGDISDYDKPDTYVIAAYANKEYAELHLRKVIEWAASLDVNMTTRTDGKAIFNPYDPLWCNSHFQSPEYYMVKVPIFDIENIAAMENSSQKDLTVYCTRCNQVSGGVFPPTSQKYRRVFWEAAMRDGKFVCSECTWNDKIKAHTMKQEAISQRKDITQ